MKQKSQTGAARGFMQQLELASSSVLFLWFLKTRAVSNSARMT